MNPGKVSHARTTEFARYVVASLAALLIDTAILLGAATALHYLVAASLGFVAGALASYFLAIRWVFRQRRLVQRRRAELGIYALVGVLGLGINDLVIFLAVGTAGLSLLGAKVVAAGITFLFNFALRKLMLFR